MDAASVRGLYHGVLNGSLTRKVRGACSPEFKARARGEEGHRLVESQRSVLAREEGGRLVGARACAGEGRPPHWSRQAVLLFADARARGRREAVPPGPAVRTLAAALVADRPTPPPSSSASTPWTSPRGGHRVRARQDHLVRLGHTRAG